jgi:hypothetical protein
MEKGTDNAIHKNPQKKEHWDAKINCKVIWYYNNNNNKSQLQYFSIIILESETEMYHHSIKFRFTF